MNKRQKIVFVLAADPNVFGGEEIQTLQLIKWLRNKYDFVVAVAGAGSFAEQAQQLGAEIVILPFRTQLLKSISALASLLTQLEISLVHTLDIRSNLIGRIAAKRAGLRSVVTTRHEMYYSPFFGTSKKIRRTAYLLLDRLTAHLCRKFIVVSKAVGSELHSLERIPGEKIQVIYNGLDLAEIDRTSDRERVDLLPGLSGMHEATTVGSAGRLVEPKGYEILVKAAVVIAQRSKNVFFFLVGEGDQRERLENMVMSLSLEPWFFFLGFKHNHLPFVRAFDIFVAPSVHEGLGLTILEAMALGKPVVATAIGGIPEVVVDGESGILVPPGNSDELAEAILTLLENRALASEMGKRGRQIIEEHFTLERMVNETEEVYKQLLTRS